MKIAIIGSENSHCGHFAATLAPKNGEKLFPELELIGVCGDNVSNEAVAKNCACEWYTNDPTAFLGKVDCVMVTSRHGGVHLEYARPYIEAGCDVWIDKPITASVEDAREMVRLVKEKGVLPSDQVQRIDLSIYPTQAEEKIFLQDTLPQTQVRSAAVMSPRRSTLSMNTATSGSTHSISFR